MDTGGGHPIDIFTAVHVSTGCDKEIITKFALRLYGDVAGEAEQRNFEGSLNLHASISVMGSIKFGSSYLQILQTFFLYAERQDISRRFSVSKC